MQLEYTAKQEQLRAEIRATLERVMTPERSGPHPRTDRGRS